MGDRAEGQAGKGRANSKRSGEISEAAFLHKAISMGFRVTKPWGDSERYDFVLDSGKRLWRVQIKCTATLHAGGYHIQPIHYVYGERKLVYTEDEIDVLAAHIVPLNVWYVVPVQALAQGASLRLYPEGGCERARFEKYREAWDGSAGRARRRWRKLRRSRRKRKGTRCGSGSRLFRRSFLLIWGRSRWVAG